MEVFNRPATGSLTLTVGYMDGETPPASRAAINLDTWRQDSTTTSNSMMGSNGKSSLKFMALVLFSGAVQQMFNSLLPQI